MAITRQKLSASTNGQPITVATGAPTTLHASTTAASTSDECHIWFVNNTAATITASLYMGTTVVSPIVVEVPAKIGPYLVAPGLFLASGIAYASAGATGIDAYGIANRLTTGA